MANTENEKSAPKVSKLPLPISDSPLVIDLPDGQKIVVGKMTQGSVIEVATWRGVGRPDSRTSRLMLGMGNGNVNEDADVTPESAPTAHPPVSKKVRGFAGALQSFQGLVKNFNQINWSATFKALIEAISTKLTPSKKKSSATTVERISPTVKVSPAVEDAEIEEWLNRISEKASRETVKPTPRSSTAKNSPSKGATKKKAAPKTTQKRKS